jgi:hypothetical protein
MQTRLVFGLSIAVLAGSACGSTPNQAAGDGSAAGGAGGGAGSLADGGGGAGTTGAAVNCGDSTVPVDPTAMIDDMEATDPSILMNGGRNGTWWAGGDPSSPTATINPNGEASATAIPGGRCGSLHAMRVSGQGFTLWAEVTASMRYGSEDGGAAGLLPYDASFRTGITFWARIGDTSANYVRFAVSDQYSRPEGGHCDVNVSTGPTACYDEFGVDLSQLGTGWTQYRIPFAGLGQRNFGLQRPALDTTAIYSIDFNFNVGEIFDFWIDDIAFY